MQQNSIHDRKNEYNSKLEIENRTLKSIKKLIVYNKKGLKS